MKFVALMEKLAREILRTLLRFVNTFVPKKKGLILFSSFPDYSGNPKFFYKYLKSQVYNHELIWIVKSKQMSKALNAKGIRTVVKRSLAGIIVFTRSQILVTSHNSFNTIKSKSQIAISLWHGIGPKKEPANNLPEHKRKLVKKLWHKTDYVISTSPEAVPHYFDFLQLPESKVKFFGYARHEFLSRKLHDTSYAREMRLRINSDEDILKKKWILFAPTWREESRNINDEELELMARTVDKYNGILLLRAHPIYGKKLVASGTNVTDVSNIRDITEYLPAFDGLITDYSSIAYDFAILRRPIVFYLYDYEEMNRIRGLNFKCPDDYPGYVAFNTEQLRKGLIEVLNGRAKNIKPVLKKFYPKDIEKACEKTAKLILRILKEGD